MKLKHVLGTVTIVAIIGGTIYAIKKSKDLKKSEGEEISLAEAKAIVADREFHKEYDKHFPDKVKVGARFEGDKLVSVSVVEELDEEEMHILKEGVREVAAFRNSVEAPYENEDFEDDEEEIEYEHMINEIDIPTLTKEDRVLRYEPNTIDALNQFISMELAEWRTEDDAYQTLLRLFEFPFQPTCDGDDMLRTAIIDYRVQFFGFNSKWATQVTYADVILHYARAAHFNCDESVRYWAEYFLDFNDLWYQYSSGTIDQTLKALNAHTYFNEERATFGLFGLTRNSMDNAIRIANRNIDGSVTYEIEFNEFLKSCI